MISLHNQRRQSSWCRILSRQAVHYIQNFGLVKIYQVKHLDCLIQRVKGIIWRLQWFVHHKLIFYFNSRRLCMFKDVLRLRWNNQVWILSWSGLIKKQKQCICPIMFERFSWLLICQMWLLFKTRFRLNIMLILVTLEYFKQATQVQVSNPKDFLELNWNPWTNIWIRSKYFKIILEDYFWKQVVNRLSTNMNLVQNLFVRVFIVDLHYIELFQVRKYISSKTRFFVTPRRISFQRLTIATNQFKSFRIFPQRHFECKFTKSCLDPFKLFIKRIWHNQPHFANFVRPWFRFRSACFKIYLIKNVCNYLLLFFW